MVYLFANFHFSLPARISARISDAATNSSWEPHRDPHHGGGKAAWLKHASGAWLQICHSFLTTADQVICKPKTGCV